MSNSTRRGFLKGAGVGVGALAVGAALPALSPHRDTSADPLPDHAAGSFMAYVTDARSGEVAVMVEGHEVTVVDHQLVARLAQVLHSVPSGSGAQA